MTLGQVVGRPGFSALKFNPIYVENCLPFLVESTTREKRKEVEHQRFGKMWLDFRSTNYFYSHSLQQSSSFLNLQIKFRSIQAHLIRPFRSAAPPRSAALQCSGSILYVLFLRLCLCSIIENFPDFTAMVSQNKNSLALLEFSEASLWTPKYKFD